MISSSNRPRSEEPTFQRGVTLLEVLLVLALTGVIAAVSLSALRGPTPKLHRQAALADLTARAVEARAKALRTGHPVTFAPAVIGDANIAGCSSEKSPSEITFLPTGQSHGGALCYALNGRQFIFEIDWLTGLPITR